MANQTEKTRYHDVLRRLIVGAFTPAIAAALVSLPADAGAAAERGMKALDIEPDGELDLKTETGETQLLPWWPYFQYIQAYNETVYIQCYVQYPQCGPACW